MLKVILSVVLLSNALCLLRANPTGPSFFFHNQDPMLRSDLYEGDIVLDEGQLLAMGVGKGVYQTPTFLRGNWPNGVVPYAINPKSEFTAKEQATILQAMKHLEDKTRVNGKDCIKFVVRTNEATYLNISDISGCYSYVGRSALFSGPQDLSLQRPRSPGAGHCLHMGTVAHELIHALGFFHEQSRADRDNFVEINFANIQSGTENNFNKQTSGYNFWGQPYDLWSIMHYEWNAFTTNGEPTVIPKDKSIDYKQLVNAALKDSITDIDVAEIRAAYGCK